MKSSTSLSKIPEEIQTIIDDIQKNFDLAITDRDSNASNLQALCSKIDQHQYSQGIIDLIVESLKKINSHDVNKTIHTLKKDDLETLAAIIKFLLKTSYVMLDSVIEESTIRHKTLMRYLGKFIFLSLTRNDEKNIKLAKEFLHEYSTALPRQLKLVTEDGKPRTLYLHHLNLTFFIFLLNVNNENHYKNIFSDMFITCSNYSSFKQAKTFIAGLNELINQRPVVAFKYFIEAITPEEQPNIHNIVEEILPSAHWMLGECYLKSLGIDRDLTKALEQFTLALKSDGIHENGYVQLAAKTILKKYIGPFVETPRAIQLQIASALGDYYQDIFTKNLYPEQKITLLKQTVFYYHIAILESVADDNVIHSKFAEAQFKLANQLIESNNNPQSQTFNDAIQSFNKAFIYGHQQAGFILADYYLQAAQTFPLNDPTAANKIYRTLLDRKRNAKDYAGCLTIIGILKENYPSNRDIELFYAQYLQEHFAEMSKTVSVENLANNLSILLKLAASIETKLITDSHGLAINSARAALEISIKPLAEQFIDLIKHSFQISYAETIAEISPMLLQSFSMSQPLNDFKEQLFAEMPNLLLTVINQSVSLNDDYYLPKFFDLYRIQNELNSQFPKIVEKIIHIIKAASDHYQAMQLEKNLKALADPKTKQITLKSLEDQSIKQEENLSPFSVMVLAIYHLTTQSRTKLTFFGGDPNFKTLLDAANANNRLAIYQVAECYKRGIGIKASIVDALRYYFYYGLMDITGLFNEKAKAQIRQIGTDNLDANIKLSKQIYLAILDLEVGQPAKLEFLNNILTANLDELHQVLIMICNLAVNPHISEIAKFHLLMTTNKILSKKLIIDKSKNPQNAKLKLTNFSDRITDALNKIDPNSAKNSLYCQWQIQYRNSQNPSTPASYEKLIEVSSLTFS